MKAPNAPVCKCGNIMWKGYIKFPKSKNPRQVWVCGECGKTKTVLIAK